METFLYPSGERATNSYMISCIKATDCCCCFMFILKHKTHTKKIFLLMWKKSHVRVYLIKVFVYLTHSTSDKSLTRAQLLSVRITFLYRSLLRDTTVEGGRGGTREPPQGQGWNALAGAGHRAQHIWRLEVTSSPCRHPSAHGLECVVSTKYSVWRGPVNTWLFFAGARWRTLLASSAKTHTHTHTHVSLDVMHIH